MEIYLAGSIHAKTFEEANGWRNYAEEVLKKAGHKVLNPMRGKVETARYSPVYIIQRDLDDINKADCLLVEMDTPGIAYCGTSMEIRQAYIWGKEIYLWGTANEGNYWLDYHMTARFKTLNDALEYLTGGKYHD